jgi:hypothetical protein
MSYLALLQYEDPARSELFCIGNTLPCSDKNRHFLRTFTSYLIAVRISNSLWGTIS